MTVLTVSKSKRECWDQCKRKFHYRYNEGIEVIKKPRPLDFGTVVHTAIELDGLGKDWTVVLDECSEDIVDEVEIILIEYFRFYRKEPFEYVIVDGNPVVEYAFKYEYKKDKFATGKIDGLVHYKGEIALLEHKTFTNPPMAKSRWKDYQTGIYGKLCPEIGLPQPTRILWNFICSKAPTAPSILKDGKVSKAQIFTLPLKVVETLNPLGYKQSEYADLLESAKENRNNYFFRRDDKIHDTIATNLWEQFIDCNRHIYADYTNLSYMNIGRHCDWCEYCDLCATELTGGDVDYIRRKKYRKRQY